MEYYANNAYKKKKLDINVEKIDLNLNSSIFARIHVFYKRQTLWLHSPDASQYFIKFSLEFS